MTRRSGPPGGGTTGWVLRFGLAVVAAGAALIAMNGAPGSGVLSPAGIVMVALVAGTAFAPGTVLPLLLLIGLVVYRLLAPGPVLDPGLALLVLLVPLIHQLAGLAAAIPARSRCAWAVLRPPALRFAIAVVPVQLALLVVAVALPAGR